MQWSQDLSAVFLQSVAQSCLCALMYIRQNLESHAGFKVVFTGLHIDVTVQQEGKLTIYNIYNPRNFYSLKYSQTTENGLRVGKYL